METENDILPSFDAIAKLDELAKTFDGVTYLIVRRKDSFDLISSCNGGAKQIADRLVIFNDWIHDGGVALGFLLVKEDVAGGTSETRMYKLVTVPLRQEWLNDPRIEDQLQSAAKQFAKMIAQGSAKEHLVERGRNENRQ